ncbi:MAG: hypothetical protein JXX28_03630 [Deltaproteobacteria bacterium]|nr:hypothetical protein [Deltaproteobacteria bacterium]
MLILLTQLLGCGGESEDPVRARFEAEFPGAYCGWLEDRKYDDTLSELLIPKHCERYYRELMSIEREHHECFSAERAEACLEALHELWWDCDTGWRHYDLDTDAYVCAARPRPLPGDCARVTWQPPCNYTELAW